MGVSFCRLRCFPQALQCFQNAVSPAAQWPPLLAKVTHNLGAALNSVGQFKSALVYHRQAAGLYGQSAVHLLAVFLAYILMLSGICICMCTHSVSVYVCG